MLYLIVILWALLTLLVWIVGLPLYLFMREQLKDAAQQRGKGPADGHDTLPR